MQVVNEKCGFPGCDKPADGKAHYTSPEAPVSLCDEHFNIESTDTLDDLLGLKLGKYYQTGLTYFERYITN